MADGYARQAGIGALLLTYAVGALSACNAVAGAYAEEVPLVVVSGAPESIHYGKQPMLHHTLPGGFLIQQQVFKNMTAACMLILKPEEAGATIDMALKECLSHSLPVFIEIPRDVGKMFISDADLARLEQPLPKPGDAFYRPRVIPAAVEEATQHVLGLINSAKKPIIVLGKRAQRVRAEVAALVDAAGLDTFTTPEGKALIPEAHPRWQGLYWGAISLPEVRSQVEDQADLVLTIGLLDEEVDTAMFSSCLFDYGNADASEGAGKRLVIHSDLSQVSISATGQQFEGVELAGFLQSLASGMSKGNVITSPCAKRIKADHDVPDNVDVDSNIDVDRLFHLLGMHLDVAAVVLDTGDSMFGGAFLSTGRGDCRLEAQWSYCSMGYALPAAIGYSIACKQPVLCICGDEAFKACAQAISTGQKAGAQVVIMILNNSGTATLRAAAGAISSGPDTSWDFIKLAVSLGVESRAAVAVNSERELHQTLSGICGSRWAGGEKTGGSEAAAQGISVVEVCLGYLEHSCHLGRLFRQKKLMAEKKAAAEAEAELNAGDAAAKTASEAASTAVAPVAT
ncbi:unnamed protein product [Chrysoparadoxa australica]